MRLGHRTVLYDVSFAIQPGEFIGVLGPNGAGKTTLMRAILGLLPPSAGSLRVFGEAPRRGNAGDRLCAAVAHGAAGPAGARTRLPRRLAQWRALGPALAFPRRAGLSTRLWRWSARRLAERSFSEMSGGERQRLLLAQALIGSPKLLLLDEPLISLDARHQEAVIEIVRQVCRERGITVLFSAHELNQLLGTLDRVLYLGSGQAALGTVDEVITAPVLSRLYGTESRSCTPKGISS